MSVYKSKVIVFSILLLKILGAMAFVSKKDVFFMFWVRGQERVEIRLETKSEILQTSFNVSKPTTFLVHGYSQDHTMDSLLKTGQ